jgi:hypothetical protein
MVLVAGVSAVVTVIVVLALSAGWMKRQLAEWHEMTYCAANPATADSANGGIAVTHRWSWRFGWPPGRWTCAYRNRRGPIVATSRVP